MAYDDDGYWYEDEDPYRYADWTNPTTGESGGAGAAPPAPMAPQGPGEKWIHDPALNEAWRNQPLGDRYPNEGGGDASLGEWAGLGIDPAAQIFDANGQLRPGWARTAQGYMFNGAGPGGAARGGRVSSGGYDSGGFAFPQFVGPRFEHPGFTAPSLEDAYGEPGYEFARREGLRAMENAASAKGVLRTGGTLKDLVGWGNKFAEQNYNNVYNRSAETYTRNYGTARDAYDRNYRAAYDEFQPRFRAAEHTFEDLYRRWRDELNANQGIASMGAA